MPVVISKKIAPSADASAASQVHHKSVEAPKGGTPSFIKTGLAAQAAIQEEQTRADLAREQSSKPFRFYIKKEEIGKDYMLTFLDGNLTKEGLIDANVWPEHFLQVSGNWTPIVCLAPEYCPVCAKDDRSTLIAAFTVVDHTPYTIQSGDKKGQVIQNTRKLFIAKRGTLGMLQKHAEKHGGLRGLQVEASRNGTKSANVGDIFNPLQKFDDKELQEMLGKDKDGNRLDLPFDYTKVAPYYSADKLADMGFGSASNIVGKEPAADLSHQL